MPNSRDAERRARFHAWWRATFGGDYPQGNARFMKMTGYTKGTSSQLWDHEYPFGEKRARELALRCGLDETAFQIASTATHTERTSKGAVTAKFPTRGQTLGEQYDLLSPEEQWRFEHLLAAAQDQPPPIGEPFKWEGKRKASTTKSSGRVSRKARQR